MATHPPKPASGPLAAHWDDPVSTLTSLPEEPFDEAQRERHRIYSLALMALVRGYWNGNKYGKEGTYHYRDGQKRKDNGQYEGGDYLGHNIASLAVDQKGNIIDFDFNHNEILNSSVEHAESRLVRRLFSLAQLFDGWAVNADGQPAPDVYYANQLNQVTLYTSLESCAQCSGIMALAAVKRVVFLQRDPGQSSIGNILRNVLPQTKTFAPPLPIPANTFGFEYFDALAAAYDEFQASVAKTPFFTRADGTAINSPSITSFLCTDWAREIFTRAGAELGSFPLECPNYAPLDDHNQGIADVLSNARVLVQARAFVAYALKNGDRGTPHRV